MATLSKPFEGYTREDFFRNVVRAGERPQLNRKVKGSLPNPWFGHPSSEYSLRAVPAFELAVSQAIFHSKDSIPRLLIRQWPAEFSELLQSCWQENPRLRPGMAQIVETVKGLLQHVEAQSKKARFFLLLDRRSSWF
jgi:hypothetical protein